MQQVRARAVRGQQPQPGRADVVQQRRDGDAGHDRQVEQGAGGGPHDLGVVDVDAGVADQDGVGAGGVGAADHGAGVAGVAHVGQHHQQARRGVEDGVERDVQRPADRQQPLRGGRVAHRGQHLGGDLVDVQPRGDRGAEDVGVTGHGVRDVVEVTDQLGAVPHHLAHGLRPLGEEQPLAGTHRAPGQRPYRLHAIRSRVGQHGGCPGARWMRRLLRRRRSRRPRPAPARAPGRSRPAR